MIAPILNELLSLYGAGIIGYFVLINLTYLLMLIASIFAVMDYLRRTKGVDYRVMVQSGSTTPISVITPAYNESQTIVASLHSFLRLNYGTMEVVAVNDGSKDDTLEVLVREFSLRKTRRMYVPHVRTKTVRGIYVSTKEEWRHLVVVDKENGGKADALNAGVNVSRYPLFCAIDADSVLENDALLKVAKPCLEDERVVAVGGIVRIANGCTVDRGRISEVRLPRTFIPLFQIVEYLRAFLSGRMGWSRLNSLLIISGAFGLFRKDVVIGCGGYRHDTVGEDMELIARIHRFCLERRVPYRVVFVPDPVCWTEAPETLRVLGRQRNRWHRGLMDSLLIHRRMFLNVRYRQVGLLAMPYFVLFELLAPVVELSGYLLIPVGAALGFFDVSLLLTFFLVSVVYGVLFSLGAVLLEEISFHRYPHPRDLARLMLAALLENFGYRQLTVWWRLRGIIDYMRGVQSWGAMQRTGFAGTTVMMRILLAEDNAVNQTVARELLKKLGHHVEIVDNGAKAVEAVRAGSYDIVLMDLHMSVMDGLEASRRIVGLSVSRPRIIAVTANVTTGTREECLNAGMDDYLSKPITLERLRAMLKKWAPADEGAAPSPSPALEGSGASSSTLGTHLLNLAADTDPAFVRELVGIFVESGTGLLDEMVRAREASDWQTLERAAHSLKGASNNIGATGLAGLCLRLEKAAAEGTGTVEQIGEIRRAFQSTEIELRAFGQHGG